MNAVKLRQPALTIRQPYAWLIVQGLKPIENRTWSTTYRGPLFIHAAVRMHDHAIETIEKRYSVKVDRDALTMGGIIGRVELIDVVTASHSKWFEGPFGWVFGSPRQMPFRALRGGQGLFEAAP